MRLVKKTSNEIKLVRDIYTKYKKNYLLKQEYDR